MPRQVEGHFCCIINDEIEADVDNELKKEVKGTSSYKKGELFDKRFNPNKIEYKELDVRMIQN